MGRRLTWAVEGESILKEGQKDGFFGSWFQSLGFIVVHRLLCVHMLAQSPTVAGSVATSCVFPVEWEAETEEEVGSQGSLSGHTRNDPASRY